MTGRKTRVILAGASGRMGRTIGTRFVEDGIVELVAGFDPVNQDPVVGYIPIAESFDALPDNLEADLVLDFSTAEAAEGNIIKYLENGLDVIIGATGFDESDKLKFAGLAEKFKKRIVLVPNFTPGANLLMKFARDAARVFKNIEIIEMHHDRKIDAPSGTALHTAAMVNESGSRGAPPTPSDRSRGRIEGNVPVHAVRLPGLLAHQEILCGSEGEVLTIRHDTTDRSAFLSGIYLAIEKLPNLKPGFTTGLEWAFD